MAKILGLGQTQKMNRKKQYTFKIAITGPESSGKTSLAKALASKFNCLWVPEFARFYLNHLGRSYLRTDLKTIGRGQVVWENWYAERSGPILICDTDWTVLQIWEQYRFGISSKEHWHWRLGYTKASSADMYLLCAPDFPWQADPLREHPEERDILFQQYEQLLSNAGAEYAIVSGPPEKRLQEAISEIGKVFGPL